MATEVAAARRRIIRRPRLTSILDESTARIRLLVAPAGYGKTTLAREWLGEEARRGVWYRGGPATADVAALAAGIAEGTGEIVPDAGKRMRERLRATGHPEEDVEILAELFAEDVQEWPADAWLAFDDYQFAMESAASERFVDLLTQQTPIQMLITSRRRPSWATARRILYGEIVEIDRRALAMEDAEARAAVNRDDLDIGPLLEGALGWPAIIGLIALNPESISQRALPDELYEYFAQELYEGLPEADRIPLGELSFATNFDRSFADLLHGSKAEGAIEAGLRAGVLAQPERNNFELHPLFSELLQERAFPDVVARKAAAARVGHTLLGAGRWDDAFDLACQFRMADLLIAVMDSALEVLTDLGRLATITRWLEAAAVLHCRAPILDLAEAEVAFRVGDHTRTEALAAQAARRLPPEDRRAAQAYVRAGHGALLANRERESIEYFRLAREAAKTPREMRESLFGLYSAMSELELPEAEITLEKLQELESDTPDDLLRSLAIKLTHAVRSGGIQEALGMAQKNLHALDKAGDPMITTSFHHAFSNALSMAGRYRAAFDSAEELHALAQRHRLDFIRPFALIDRAVARIGLRDFDRATRDLDLAGHTVPASGDPHIEGNLAAIRCRLFVAVGRPSDAVRVTRVDFQRGRPSGVLEAEILAGRALALSCASRKAEALGTLDEAESVSINALVVQVLGPAVRCVCAPSPDEAQLFASAAWKAALTTGNMDTLVAAYRGSPSLLELIARSADKDRLACVVRDANDADLAHRYAISVRAMRTASERGLTPRETEVMKLVASGASNREAARTLFISEATIKVHLRHVYEKLGVRGRTEAIAKWLTRP